MLSRFLPYVVIAAFATLMACNTKAETDTFVRAPAANAGLLDVRNASTVAGALRQAGYKAELKTGKDGDPYIQSAANGSPFTIEFYGCDKTSCNSLQFRSWYKREAIFTPALANQRNANKRFIKLAVDQDGDLNEYMDVTAIGKMTQENFADWIDWYETMDARVDSFIADARKGKVSATD